MITIHTPDKYDYKLNTLPSYKYNILKRSIYYAMLICFDPIVI